MDGRGFSSAGAAWPPLALVLNAFVWGVSWWPFRELQSHGLHPLWATALIYLVSMACLLAVRPRVWHDFGGQPLLWLLMAGVAIVLKTPGSPWPVPESAADWLALMGGFSFALTNILLRKLHGATPAARILSMFVGGALLATGAAVAGAALGSVPWPPPPQAAWALVGLVLSLGFLVGNVALQYEASRMSAHAAALIMLSEVVFASLSSVALGAAQLNGRTLLGGALILAAAAWSAWPAGESARV